MKTCPFDGRRALLSALTALVLAALSPSPADAQVTLSGSIQSDLLLPEDDERIGTDHYSEAALTNSYVDVRLQSPYVDAGGRFEYLEHPLPGFESDFKGWGVPHLFVKGKLKNLELTLGDYYEQFGSGFVLRTYEERSLGIDNALRGARIVYRPSSAITMKVLTGKQRRYWTHNPALVSGGDVELNLERWIAGLDDRGAVLTLGASIVNKHESADEDNIFVDLTHRLNLPENVYAWDARVNWQQGGLSVLAEYAGKTQDPQFDLHYPYIYKNGSVAMLSGSYSRHGMSVLLQAKRSDNMSFRSRRSITGTSSFINHLPAFTHDQTYALAALYPYATQPNGEWAYQVELGFTLKKKSALGGRYGTKVRMNVSYVRAIEHKNVDGGGMGTDGYRSGFFQWGDDTYYSDLDVQIEKRLTKAFRLNLMYMNQLYNKTVVEGEGGNIYSNIFIGDGRYQFSPKTTLRCELQYLTTGQDEHDWAFALAELSLAPHWMFTASDMYNIGVTKIHYYQSLVTYNLRAHRLQIGYVRTRAGYNCSGGVCRWVPAQKGFTASYNYNF